MKKLRARPPCGPSEPDAYIGFVGIVERFFNRDGLVRSVVPPESFDRWIAFEIGRLNANLVVEKKSLARLLIEPDPACRTREGTLHTFEPEALARFASVLAAEEVVDLRLPLTLLVRGDTEDARLMDEIGAKALRAVEKFDRAFPFRDGGMALPHSLAMDLVRRHGGVLQIAFG